MNLPWRAGMFLSCRMASSSRASHDASSASARAGKQETPPRRLSRRSQQSISVDGTAGKDGPAKAPGIRDLAARLGLGVSTVSRAMNNRDRVDEKTRKRVLAMARKIGYVPDPAARRLKSHPRLRVEVLFSPYPDPHHAINPAALATVEALHKRAQARGILLTLREFTRPGSATEVKVAVEVVEQMRKQMADVIVLYGHFHADTLAVLNREPSLLTVCLQRLPASHHQVGVTVDTRSSAYQAVAYLAALGHTRFALVAGGRGLHHQGYREGFSEALEEFRLTCRPDWRIALSPGKINEEGAAKALTPLLSLPAPERPSALVFSSDWLAMGGLRAARQLGLDVPGEVSLIGFDNVPVAASCEPPLSSFDVHRDTMADAVLDAAIELMENPAGMGDTGPAVHMVHPDIVKRGTCAVWGR